MLRVLADVTPTVAVGSTRLALRDGRWVAITPPEPPAESPTVTPLPDRGWQRVVDRVPLDVALIDGRLELRHGPLLTARYPVAETPAPIVLTFGQSRLRLIERRPAVRLADTPTEPATRPGETAAERVQRYDDAALTALFAGDHGRLLPLIERWYAADWTGVDRVPADAPVAPPLLIRLVMYHLEAAGEWEVLRLVALRHRYLVEGRADDEARRLAGYMLHRAAPHVRGPTGVDDVMPPSWRHPLAVAADREGEARIAELLEAIETGQVEQAARLITSRPFRDELVSVTADGDLFHAAHDLVDRAVGAVPALIKTLERDHAGLAEAQYHRALADDDVDALAAVASQFRGTRAARLASLRLGDRSLRRGEFVAAARRYYPLIDGADADLAAEAYAKYRLANAMLGQLQGAPVRSSVSLGDRHWRPREFEKMLEEIAAARRTVPLSPPPTVPAPPPTDLDVQLVASLSTPATAASVTVAGDTVIVQRPGALAAYRLRDGRRLWTRPMVPEGQSPAEIVSTPVVTGQRVFATSYTDNRGTLGCYAEEDGKPLWNVSLDAEVISDPFLVGDGLYTLALDDAIGERAHVVLHRVDPATGNSIHSGRLCDVRLTGGDALPHAGRPAVRDSTILVALPGVLINSDPTGQVRWVRRIDRVPTGIDAGLDPAGSPPGVLIAGGLGFVTTPSSPWLTAVDLATGELRWRWLTPGAARPVLMDDGVLVASTPSGIVGLSTADGSPRWAVKQPVAEAFAGDRGLTMVLSDPRPAVIAEDGSEASPATAEVSWLDADRGRVKRRVTLTWPWPRAVAAGTGDAEIVLLTAGDGAGLVRVSAR